MQQLDPTEKKYLINLLCILLLLALAVAVAVINDLNTNK
jgi:hypothetical protein